MKKLALFTLALFAFTCFTNAQRQIITQSPAAAPLHEMRGVWLTTIGGIDWPHSYAKSAATIQKQQLELCSILDQLSAAGINTVFLQTRVRGTTIFPSNMEPWDGCLSGNPGTSPGYDALAYAIQECHRRGMKLHAWVVTIPIGRPTGAGVRNLQRTHPELIKRIGDEAFMNPEHSGTASYLAQFCGDLTTRYDIDGIHLDYIRYPETWGKIPNKDAARANITNIVRAIHQAVKQTKPWVMLSCSPVGKYADTKRQWSRGWNARDAVCQDAAMWLQTGLMDALLPMMYFKDENFYPFAIDWKERSAGRIVAPGLGIYFMHPNEKNWALQDITREMHVSRQYGMGVSMFRSKFFTDNTKGIYQYTKDAFSPGPALQPTMSWYNVAKPMAPTSLHIKPYNGREYLLTWENPNRFIVSFNVYGSSSYPVDTRDASNLLMTEYSRTAIQIPMQGNTRFYAVTCTDKYGNESPAVQLNLSGSSTMTQRSSNVNGMIPLDGKYLILNGYDVTAGALVTFNSNITNAVNSGIVRRINGGNLAVDISNLLPGYYTLRIVNKKGHSHLVGRFAIEPKIKR